MFWFMSTIIACSKGQEALLLFGGFHDTLIISFDFRISSNMSNNPDLISSCIPKASFTMLDLNSCIRVANATSP